MARGGTAIVYLKLRNWWRNRFSGNGNALRSYRQGCLGSSDACQSSEEFAYSKGRFPAGHGRTRAESAMRRYAASLATGKCNEFARRVWSIGVHDILLSHGCWGKRKPIAWCARLWLRVWRWFCPPHPWCSYRPDHSADRRPAAGVRRSAAAARVRRRQPVMQCPVGPAKATAVS